MSHHNITRQRAHASSEVPLPSEPTSSSLPEEYHQQVPSMLALSFPMYKGSLWSRLRCFIGRARTIDGQLVSSMYLFASFRNPSNRSRFRPAVLPNAHNVNLPLVKRLGAIVVHRKQTLFQLLMDSYKQNQMASPLVQQRKLPNLPKTRGTR